MKIEISSGPGVGLLGILTILFIGLKLTHYIDWSWWWVLSPMLVTLVFVVGILIATGIIVLINSKSKKHYI